MSKKTYADLTEEEKEERRLRAARVLVAGFEERMKDKRVREEDIIDAAVAAYKVDPKKGGH